MRMCVGCKNVQLLVLTFSAFEQLVVMSMTSFVTWMMTSSVDILWQNKLFWFVETSRLNVFEVQHSFRRLQDHLELQTTLLVLVSKKYYF